MSAARFWVVCPEFVSGPHGSREIAERRLAGIVEAGQCWEAHKIVESALRPATAWREALGPYTPLGC